MSLPDDPLNLLFERWKKAPPALRPVAQDVWRRIATEEDCETSRTARRWRLWALGGGALAFAAACVVAGFVVAQARLARSERDYDSLVMQSYLRLIDPLADARASAVEPADKLAALQRDLQLTPAQLDSLRTLYERSAPRLRELAAQEARMREELYAFESHRRTGGRVDFVEFARFADERRRLERECADSTQRIVDASAGVMNPRQRARFLRLLDSAPKAPGDRWLD